MIVKKNPSVDYHRHRILFFSIGLVIALLMVIVAFEWKTYERPSEVQLTAQSGFEQVYDDVPITEQAPPEPARTAPPVIVEVADEMDIEEEIAIDLDIEITEETSIESIVSSEAPEEEQAESIFSIVEEMPSFPGGNSSFYNWVAENLQYPKSAKKAKVEGRVVLRFVVSKEGDVSEVEVVKGIGFGCDEEAVRVVMQSPQWNPGKQRGKSVDVWVTVPLMFKLS